MKKIILLLPILFFQNLSAQSTWSSEIASILYKNCTNCHNPNGIAPFSMLDYTTTKQWANAMAYRLQNGEMPPWKPDTSYQRFVHERILTNSEKSKIINWITAGAPSGDLTQAPAPPVYPAGGVLPNPDLTVKMATYTSKATSQKDDYICISIPSGLTKSRKIKAVEVVPGNRKIVHHTLVFVDPTGQYQSDTIGGDCASPSSGKMITGYAPGGQPTIFPNGGNFKTGMTLPPNSNIILALHYSEGSAGQKDSTSVNFFFYDENETGVREISTDPLLENWLFCIDANTVQTVDDWYPHPTIGTNQDFSLLSIFPHSHLLGDRMESYSINGTNDTTPLILIPHWDFEWQDFYFFKNIKKLEAGSRIYGSATYDNRASNPHNPFSPPQKVCAGLNTSSEMFIFYFHYMGYLPGDELVNIDSLMQINPVGLEEHPIDGSSAVSVFPNPSAGSVNLVYTIEGEAFVNLYIYDVHGKLVKRLEQGLKQEGSHQLKWNRVDDSGEAVSAGVYFYSLKVDQQLHSGRIIIN